MCGITGIWHTSGAPADPQRLRTATDLLRHRGPDDEGYLFVATRSARVQLLGGPATDAALGLPTIDTATATGDLAFGFRRLAIIDLSPAGHQPMASADGRAWLVFNGEIYNYRELRDELRALGHTFRSASDSEVLLAGYTAWGAALLPRLNGMFALAIYDTAARTLLLARDHAGIKPLYYSWDGTTLAFASEIKALVGRHALPFAPDDQAIYRYLIAGELPDPRSGTTFFQGVHALPPGHALQIQRGETHRWRWWQPLTDKRALSAAAATAEFRETFTDAVRLQLNSDRPVGTCLSGGLDSSSIVCVANRLLGGAADGRQKTFSAVYASDGRHNERLWVDRVVAATGVDATFTWPDADGLLADAERLVWQQDEPFGSTSIFAQWCVMRAVRQRGVIVVLDGQGADEVLGGYSPYLPHVADALRAGRIDEALTRALLAGSRAGVNPWRVLAFAGAMQLPAAIRSQLRRVRPGAQPDFAPLQRDLVRANDATAPHEWHDWEAQRTLHDELAAQVEWSSLPHLLRYEDRNAMAWGVESRVPFLDTRLMALAAGAAAPYRVHRGWTKWVLRQAMDGILPDAVTWRSRKVGFETPEADWMQALLAARPQLFADGARSGRYLDLANVRAQIASGSATAREKWRLWRWVNLELWLTVWGAA